MKDQGYLKGTVNTPKVPIQHFLCEVPTLDKNVRAIFRREEDKLTLIIQNGETVTQFINLHPEYRKALAFWLLGDIR